MNITKLVFIFIINVIFFTNGSAQNRKIGIGPMLGEPTGVNVKFWLSNAYDWSVSHGIIS